MQQARLQFNLPQTGEIMSVNQKLLKSKFQNEQNLNSEHYKNNLIQENRTRVNILTMKIKDCKVLFNKNNSFSQNKLKSRRTSILSQIYRPVPQSKSQDQISRHINDKNMGLIRENINKMKIGLPNAMLSLYKSSGKNKLHLNHSSKDSCRSERIKKNTLSKQNIFLFQDQPESVAQHKSHFIRFDRAKYFNCQNYLNKQQSKNTGKQNAKSYFLSKQKACSRINSNGNKEHRTGQNVRRNTNAMDELAPIFRQKTAKPKTAGGFLKKYDIQQLCLSPDFQIRIDVRQRL